MSKVKVMIVEDHPFFRQGLRDVVAHDESLEVVAEAADGKHAIQLAYQHQPDVILMDINLPTINGLQVTKRIKAGLNEAKIITITGYDDAQQVFHALRAGASAYCSKAIMPTTLVELIHQVNVGYYVVGEKKMTYDELVIWLDEKLGVPGALNSDSDESFVPLSAREMEILEQVTFGKSNKEIAFLLGISHQTVKNHMTAILRKLRVDDRTQAAVLALKNGWVRLDSIGGGSAPI